MVQITITFVRFAVKHGSNYYQILIDLLSTMVQITITFVQFTVNHGSNYYQILIDLLSTMVQIVIEESCVFQLPFERVVS